ncbi:ataxin-2 [Schizosaccharomyces cryophilus OY26]|uniref:Ataxin-2 n=1 Tax=Schizosaccharomyces cryophilus (strain OY26 / ATCC MYA-4695 / CBS 11777 / NBRC 106824 / NRRL Y48691) TaxID=653667 RepID=S9W144_SCHCR|nr:ataxin-2 [Schizosaccharomyces cryophilus OY26]EPY52204.1 ataxin-2 [Schizosaccharomyces cryophilus OY26]
MATDSVRMEQTPQRNAGPTKTETTKKWSAVAAKGSKASQSTNSSERIFTETKRTVPDASVKDNAKDNSNVNSMSSTNKRSTNAPTGRANNAYRTSSSNSKSWKTDTAISSHRGSAEHRERELLPWRPDPQDASASLMSLEESENQTGGGEWDQFAANEKLFGVQSHFDEEQYTSTINRSHPKYKERAQEADRIAKEIETSATDNIHIAEERGRKVDDSGLDEEDLYSGVQRSSLPGKNNNRGSSSRDNYSQGKSRDHRYRNAGPRNVYLPNDPAIVSQRHMAFSRGGDSRAAEKFFNARRKMGTLSKGEKEGQIKEFMQFSQSLKLGGFENKEDPVKENKDASKEKQKSSKPADEIPNVDVSKNDNKQKEEVPFKDGPSLEKGEKEPDPIVGSNKEEKTQEKKEDEPKPAASLESGKEQVKPANKDPSKALKLNAKAASFKPNVGAPVFTPGKFVLPVKPVASQPMSSQKSSSTETGSVSKASNIEASSENKERAFFPDGGSPAESSVMENFNVIKTAAEQEQIGETLEKPFSCPPTWASGPNNLQHIVSNQKIEADPSQGKRNSATSGPIPGLVLPNTPVSPAMTMYPPPNVPYIPFGYSMPGYPPYMRAASQQASVTASPSGTPTSGNSSAVASPMFMAPPVMPPYGVPPFQAQGSPRGVAPATYYVPQMGGMPMMTYPVNGVPPMYGQYAMNNGMMNMRYPMYTDSRRSNSQRSFNPSRGNRHQNNGHKNENYNSNHNNSNDGNNATIQNQDSTVPTTTDSRIPESSEVVEPAPTADTSDEKAS